MTRLAAAITPSSLPALQLWSFLPPLTCAQWKYGSRRTTPFKGCAQQHKHAVLYWVALVSQAAATAKAAGVGYEACIGMNVLPAC